MTKFNIRSEMLTMLRKYVDGKASEAEIRFLDNYYEHFDQEQEILENMTGEEQERFEAELRQVITSAPQQQPVETPRISIIKRIAAAAVLMVICSTALYFYSEKSENPGLKAVVKPKVQSDDIVPGRNTAILTLADGTKVNLDSAGNGQVARQSGLSIQKNGNQLVYSSDGIATQANQNLFNIIETPRGGEYRVVLPDGTRVWLNAASSLKYPAAFLGSERTVELQGEAYFEVASNKKMPFRVKSNTQVVEVLGTHFNINSYADESSTKTTLLEGSVKVYTGDEASRILKVGQQSSVNNSLSAISVSGVNTKEIIAWKNGYFVFNNENIESVMRMISRWYNVDIEYKGKIPKGGFGGAVSKSKNISEVLRILELTKAVHFKVQGRRVTVMT